MITIETTNAELDEHYIDGHQPVRPGPYVMLAVSDTGVGMDEATKARLFEPFFTTKPTGKGTGLGLATVYGIVKQSGGYVWAYSEPGRGSSFKVYLPRIGVRPPDLAPLPAVSRSPDGRETVLLVEGEEEVLRATRRGLEAHGYTVLAARSGDDALAIAASHVGKIHLLVTDVVMPGMNGRDLAYGLGRERPDMRVLYVSGYPDQAVLHHGLLTPGMGSSRSPSAPTSWPAGSATRSRLSSGGEHPDHSDRHADCGLHGRGRGPADDRAPPRPHRDVRPAGLGVFEEHGAGERPDETGDDAADHRNREPDEGAHEPTEHGAPRGATRAAVSLGQPEADPPLDHLAEDGKAEDDADGREADRLESREPGGHGDGEHHEPETGQAERDEEKPGDAARDEKNQEQPGHGLDYNACADEGFRIMLGCDPTQRTR